MYNLNGSNSGYRCQRTGKHGCYYTDSCNKIFLHKFLKIYILLMDGSYSIGTNCFSNTVVTCMTILSVLKNANIIFKIIEK